MLTFLFTKKEEHWRGTPIILWGFQVTDQALVKTKITSTPRFWRVSTFTFVCYAVISLTRSELYLYLSMPCSLALCILDISSPPPQAACPRTRHTDKVYNSCTEEGPRRRTDVKGERSQHM